MGVEFALLMLAFLIAVSQAEPLTVPTSTDLTVLMGSGQNDPSIPLGNSAAEALSKRDHSVAVAALQAIDPSDFSGTQTSTLGFLKAWSLIRAGKGEDALPYLGHVEQSSAIPMSYRLLTAGEIHLAQGAPQKAAEAFGKIDPSEPIASRAKLQLAKAFKQAGSTKDAMALYEEVIQRSDPAEGNDLALWALAQRKGLSNPASKTWLRRLWMHYPLTKSAKQAHAALKTHHGPPSKEELGTRIYRLMELGAWSSVIGSVESRLSGFPLSSETGCRVRYAYGRSLFKRNKVTAAAAILGPVGEQCAELDKEHGPKALYIAGKSFERKKAWAKAAAVFQRIPELYPDHSMADDGYALGGVAWREAGHPRRAQELWSKQADAYPTGDMAGEGFWRLAWSAYQEGDTNRAIDWAERMVREVPIEVAPGHVVGGQYWAARWRLYPDVAHPEILSPDNEAVSDGIERLVSLCNAYPASFYTLFAAARLTELAPQRLKTLTTPSLAVAGQTWTVRKAFVDHPATQRGLALARAGLAQEAMSEFNTLGSKLTPSETAVVTSVQETIAPYLAHDRLHRKLLHHPPSTLGPDRDRVLLQALPDHYFDIISAVTSEYDFDPRIFHALVREESSFNKDIRSWAGARGLSQLMPPTGHRVAKWLGLNVSTAQLQEPKTNLAIGSRYLHYLFKHFDNNPFLAIAAYNAGEGNVGKWVTRFGNIPTDEFVENIPFRETRHYVKRVLGTYQAYRSVRGPQGAPPQWAHTNHQVIVP
jgi:soluble lytic murein transglycosylase